MFSTLRQSGVPRQEQSDQDEYSLTGLCDAIDRIRDRWTKANNGKDDMLTAFGSSWSIDGWAEHFKTACRGDHTTNSTRDLHLWKDQSQAWRSKWVDALNRDDLSTDVYSVHFPAFERLRMSIRRPNIFMKRDTSWIRTVTAKDLSLLAKEDLYRNLAPGVTWKSTFDGLKNFSEGALDMHRRVSNIGKVINHDQELTAATLDKEGAMILLDCLTICQRASDGGNILIQDLVELRKRHTNPRAQSQMIPQGVPQPFQVVARDRQTSPTLSIGSQSDGGFEIANVDHTLYKDKEIVARIHQVAKRYWTHRRDPTEQNVKAALLTLSHTCGPDQKETFKWLLSGLERLHDSQLPNPRGFPSTRKQLLQLWDMTLHSSLTREEALMC
ncbi:hypothetical protein JCM5353_004005 [Sporobolomyces roseus]